MKRTDFVAEVIKWVIVLGALAEIISFFL